MLDKREEFLTKFACVLSLYFVHTTRNCLTDDMTNCLKSMKNSLNEIIDDIVFDFQWASHLLKCI